MDLKKKKNTKELLQTERKTLLGDKCKKKSPKKFKCVCEDILELVACAAVSKKCVFFPVPFSVISVTRSLSYHCLVNYCESLCNKDISTDKRPDWFYQTMISGVVVACLLV